MADTVPAVAVVADLEPQLEEYRRELTGYCYRMLGSLFEADDAVQETMLRAWRSYDRFEGRSSLRSWLYRIATNVCLDMLAERKRRARPMDLGAPQTADMPLPPPIEESAWIEPAPDDRVLVSGGDPVEVALARESVKLAFMAALQHLPPKQRAVLILREVLRWRATEVAELLGTSVASVNSALQRARETLQSRQVSLDDPQRPMDEASSALLARYVEAFESYDMDALTALLHEDADWNMPPYAMWLQTHRDIVDWCLGPGIACQGSRLIPVDVNGSLGFAQYKPGPPGRLEPWSIQVVEMNDGKISGLTFFLDTARFFPLWGLPPYLDA
ncbi:MAG TPA: sigma-70 family RNA polymerase sigma factor [Candidatus Limnocylindrales bacterium]|nr:sigma-70 family RNA polymerase sigma factor [Candidatus Limnocylindrales bacterium]